MSYEKKYSSLVPKDNIDLNCYQDALDYAMRDESIHNIAISGAYGSGKSSVIQSYEGIHKEKKFIHISLAYFEEQGKRCEEDNKQNISSDEEENVSSKAAKATNLINILEGKILNQLLHQIDPKKIPLSRFKVKETRTLMDRVLKILGISVFVISLFYITMFQRWSDFVNSFDVGTVGDVFKLSTKPIGQMIAGALCILLVGLWMNDLLKRYDFRDMFKKVDVKGVVVEIFESQNDSYFDKYLNEVVYLFENSGAAAIVFEDLDRYDVTKIFEKLREINELLWRRKLERQRSKQSNEEQNKATPKFFYLIRDDIFSTADRSKFFDFIIPIVPVIDASNSCDEFIRKFREIGMEGELQERFLQDISLYLSDMRLVTNIVNEFITYRERLEKLNSIAVDRQSEKQLAMVIYKNLYPRDFTLLQQGFGYVYTLFENKHKHKLIEKRRTMLEGEIRSIEVSINKINKENLNSIHELNAIYFHLPEAISSINDMEVDQKLQRADLVKKVLEHPGDVWGRLQNGNHRKIDIDGKRQNMQNDTEYQRRKKVLEDKETQEIERLKLRIKELEAEKDRLSSSRLQELIEDDENDGFWEIELPLYEENGYLDTILNTRGYYLLRYLIRHGYINENYSIYTSYFYSNSLSVADKNFLLALANREKLEYSYCLVAPEKILTRLDKGDFLRKESYNYDLLEFILSNFEHKYLETWFDDFEKRYKSEEEAFSYLFKFWETGRVKKRLIQEINNRKPHWFRMWKEDGLLQEADWRSYALDTIIYTDRDCLIKMNVENWLTNAISEDELFLQINNPDEDKLLEAFVVLGVKFRYIKYRNKDISLITRVFQEDCYELNGKMIHMWMKDFWSLPDEEIKQRSYTRLRQKADEPLSVRVENEIDRYMDIIMEDSDVEFEDSYSAVVNLLNNENISHENRQAYIKRMKTGIINIVEIKKTKLWPTIMEYNLVKYKWENIADYYCNFYNQNHEMPCELISFLEKSNEDVEWNWSLLTERIREEDSIHLYEEIIKCEKISPDRYQVLLKPLCEHSYNQFPFKDLSDKQIKILIDLEIIPMTDNNVEIVREYYQSQMIYFILTNENAEKYVMLAANGKIKITEEEITTFLADESLDISIRLEMLDVYDDKLKLKGKDYLDEIKVEIIEFHFSLDDAEELIRTFDSEANMIQNSFIRYTQKNIEDITNEAEKIKFMPLSLYAKCLDAMDESQAERLRRCLVDVGFEAVCSQNRNPKFAETEDVKIVLDYFEKQGWISSYKTISDGIIRANSKRRD